VSSEAPHSTIAPPARRR